MHFNNKAARNLVDKATLVGWGLGRNRTYPHAPIRPLQEVYLPVLTTEGCQRERRNYRLNDDQVCVDPVQGASSCNGDWGGPLFMYHETYDTHIQIGVSSWVNPLDCGNITNTGTPPGWTKVSKFVEWIEDAVRACDPQRTQKLRKHVT